VWGGGAHSTLGGLLLGYGNLDMVAKEGVRRQHDASNQKCVDDVQFPLPRWTTGLVPGEEEGSGVSSSDSCAWGGGGERRGGQMLSG